MKDFALSYDILGTQPQTYFAGKPRYQTVLGFVLTVLCYMAIITLGVYFLLQFINKQSFSIVYSQYIDQAPSIDLTSSPIVVSLTDANAVPINNSGIATLSMWQRGYMKSHVNGTPTFGLVYNPIPLEKCNISKHFVNYSSLYQDVPGLETFYCVVPGSMNLTIFGQYGDVTSGFTYLDLQASKCVNSTANNNSCARPEVIDAKLGFVYMAFGYLEYQINHTNIDNPISLYRTNELGFFSTSIFKRYFTYFKRLEYHSDNGIVFEEIDSMIGYQHDNTVINYDLKPPANYPNMFAEISVTMSKKYDSYSRSFVKLQNIVANIGGMSNLILTSGAILVQFFTTKMYFLGFSELIVDFNDKSKPRESIVVKHGSILFGNKS